MMKCLCSHRPVNATTTTKPQLVSMSIMRDHVVSTPEQQNGTRWVRRHGPSLRPSFPQQESFLHLPPVSRATTTKRHTAPPTRAVPPAWCPLPTEKRTTGVLKREPRCPVIIGCQSIATYCCNFSASLARVLSCAIAPVLSLPERLHAGGDQRCPTRSRIRTHSQSPATAI